MNQAVVEVEMAVLVLPGLSGILIRIPAWWIVGISLIRAVVYHTPNVSGTLPIVTVIMMTVTI
jgi:hypothetical protein